MAAQAQSMITTTNGRSALETGVAMVELRAVASAGKAIVTLVKARAKRLSLSYSLVGEMAERPRQIARCTSIIG